jgi:hypothetical protein
LQAIAIHDDDPASLAADQTLSIKAPQRARDHGADCAHVHRELVL